MKCEFSRAGVLRVIPETPVEQFALDKWNRAQIEIAECDWDIRGLKAMEDFVKEVESRRDEYRAWLKQRTADSAGAEPK